MKIEQIPIHRLEHEVYDDDPRRLTQLSQSIQQHGIKEPLEIWDHKGHLSVQDGKHRLEVARKLKLSHVPAIVTSSEKNKMTNEALLDDLLDACTSKEPTKIADAFNQLMLGKTYERIQAEKQQLGQTMFNPEPVVEAESESGYKTADGTVLPYNQWHDVHPNISIMPKKTTFNMKHNKTGEIVRPSGQAGHDAMMMSLYHGKVNSTYAHHNFGQDWDK